MRNRQFAHWGSLVLLTVSVSVGCKPAGPAPSGQPATMTANAGSPRNGGPKSAADETWNLPDTDKPHIVDQKGVDAQALAQATQDYANAMEHARARRANQRGAATIPSDSSNVQFENPGVERERVREPAVPGGQNATPAAANIGANTGQAGGQSPMAALNPPLSIPAPTITQTPQPEINKDSPAVNMPLVAAQPRPLPSTDDLAQKMLKQVKDYPQDPAAQLDWQLLQMLQGQSVPQLQMLSTLNAEDREMLSAVLDGVANYRNALRADGNMLLSRKIRPMLELSDRLRTQAELSIPTIALCSDVKGFGVYDSMEPARFPADNKEHRVIVYCEIENFASQLDDQKRWQTKLSQDLVLYTEQNGLEIWRDKTATAPIIDYSRNRRHDFFIRKMVRLPANLTIGRYLLKVTITDKQVDRMAENTVPITIVAQ